MTRNMSFFKNLSSGFIFLLLSVFLLLMPMAAHSDDLGEFLLKEIKAKPSGNHSDAALLLLSRDLGWYEAHMKKLPQGLQDQVQNLRIRVVGESTRSAAQAMGEPADIFLASGSCNPGRDIDLLYVGKNTSKATQSIESAILQTTTDIITKGTDDPLLKAAAAQGLSIPKGVTSSAMDVVASDLPNFGYNDLNIALDKARGAMTNGDPNAIKILQKEMHEALMHNLDAQVKSKAKDMYRGAEGQRFFAKNYLGDPEKVRRIRLDEAGSWVLRPGGKDALSGLVLDQVDALMPSSRRATFAKVASDLAMFHKHGKGGIGGTAKYVDRIAKDVDGIALLTFMDNDEASAFLAARQISKNPSDASVILKNIGLSESQVVEGVKRAMYQTVENQLLLDVNKLLTELDQIDAAKGANAMGALENLYNKQLLKFDINDLANGLTALSDVPGVDLKKILETLEEEFGNRKMGKNVLAIISDQLKLFTGESSNLINRRLAFTLFENNEISSEEYYDLKRHIQIGDELPVGNASTKLKKARQEILYLSSVDMLELDVRTNSIDDIVEDWRRQRSNALIRTVPDEIRQTVKELKTLPADELKKLGWLEIEIELPMETRLKIKLGSGQMADMATRLQSRLGKQAISLMEWQRQTRKYIFSLTPTELGEAGDLGPMDAVFSVATGMYQTYTILNSYPAMNPDDENLALGNAWVTALPIVGDFAEGMLAGIDAGFTGNKRKALESGLYLSIGIMAVVPGGQIPAMVTSMIMAGSPIAEGIYNAHQAQNLVQAWISSGRWEGGDNQPMVLTGLFDRAGLAHPLTYKYLLTSKGNTPYESEKADGMFSVPTINGSIREYAEKYVFPQYPKIKEYRESLKHIFPTFNDKDWEYEFDAKFKVKKHGGKAALVFFEQYYKIRTQALNHTIAQLKEWAEEEYRVSRDYEGEINKVKEELHSLGSELKVRTLVTHANDSAEAYSKVIKNVMEKETLPLSRYRIYKHYLLEYRQVAVQHRKINRYLDEVPDSYKPMNWHLTGYPEFDRPRMEKLANMMKNGRANAVSQVEKLIRDFGFQSKGGFDPDNPCQHKALQILLGYRYKVAFIENLVEYFNTLAESESVWSDSYNSARARYIDVRDQYTNLPQAVQKDVAHKAIGDALMTYVASMPYALASGERDLYRNTASDFKVKMKKAMYDYDRAASSYGEPSKALETCLMASMKVEISLSPLVPKKGQTIIVKGKLISALPPKAEYYHWKADGELILESTAGPEVKATVNGPGTLMVEVVDDFESNAKVLAEANMRVVTSEIEIVDEKDKDKDEEKAEKEVEKEKQPELTNIDVTLRGPTKIVTVGTKVSLSSSVGGGRGPYQYEWSGVTSSSSTASFTPSHAGDLSISVVVTDADGVSSEAVTTVRVGPAKVKLKGAKGQVSYGTRAILSGSGMGLEAPVAPTAPAAPPLDCSSGDNPFCVDTDTNATYTPTEHPDLEIPDDTDEGHWVPDPDNEFASEPPEKKEYKVVWQSEPGLTFEPPQGPDSTTTVTYDRVGEVKVWCELLKFIDGSYQTVAESEQVIVNVTAPDFKISYEPANGQAYVGQQVIATIHAKPSLSAKLIDYRWLDPATSNRLEMGSNASRIAFKVRDINPIKLKVLARVPVYGDELSEIESSYTGMAYGVNAWMVQPPNLPRTWDPKAGGLKTIKRGSRATGEQITLKAEVQGGAAPAGVRWSWTVNPGTAISNTISQAPRVSRSNGGTITARVTAKDKNGNKLGEATVTVDVIELVSPPTNLKKPENPKTGAQKKAAAEKMVDQARDQLARGDMVAAEKSVLAAKELDPKTAAPVIEQVAKAAKTSGWRAVNLWDFPKAQENLEVSDRLAPANADTQKKLKKLKEFQKIWPRVMAKVQEFDKYVAGKKPFSAHKALLEMQNLQKGIPGGGSSPLRQRISDDFNQAFDEYRAVILELEQKSSKFSKEKNWQGVIDISLPVLNRELDQNRRDRIQGSIDFARKMLAEQRKKDMGSTTQRNLDKAKQKAEIQERQEAEKIKQEKAHAKEKETARIESIFNDAKSKWQNNERKDAIAKLDDILAIDSTHQDAMSLKKKWQDMLIEINASKPIKSIHDNNPNNNLLINGDFEQGPTVGSYVTLHAGSNDLDGWNIERATIDIVGSSFEPASGNRSIDMCGTPGCSTLTQTIATQKGATYDLVFYLSGNTHAGKVKTLEVKAGNKDRTFTFDISGKSKTDMQWRREVMTFQALGDTTKISFIAPDKGNDTYAGPTIDNVQIRGVASSYSVPSTATKEQTASSKIVINNPMVDGVALDYCLKWGVGCGKPAADAWCQTNGYSQSISYDMKDDFPPTQIIATGEICNEAACDRITEITCKVFTKEERQKVLGTSDKNIYPDPSITDEGADITVQNSKVTLNYLGCYQETGHKDKVVPSMQSRVMNGYTFKGNMTVRKCSETCFEKGFKYAGLQYANQCLCDNTFDDYGKADNCNMPCSGNNNEMCGGAWANSVYELTNQKATITKKSLNDTKEERQKVIVTSNKNIYPDPSVTDEAADTNHYVIDGNQSLGWVRLFFKNSNLNMQQNKSINLKLTISTVEDGASTDGITIYHKDIVVGRVPAVARGEVVEVPLDMSKTKITNGELELILRATGTDAAFIESKSSGHGAELLISKEERQKVIVTSDENIYPDPSVTDDSADRNHYIIDGNQSLGSVRLFFKDSILNVQQNKSIILELTISTIENAESKNGIIVYHKDIVVGRISAVARGRVVEIPLDISKIQTTNGRLELILKAGGNDGVFIKSKATGQGAELIISK